jgi:hypothetical protein
MLLISNSEYENQWTVLACRTHEKWRVSVLDKGPLPSIQIRDRRNAEEDDVILPEVKEAMPVRQKCNVKSCV